LPSDLGEEGRYYFSLNAIIIDEEFARRHWPNESAVGKRVRLGGSAPDAPLATVVGVVGRVKMESLSGGTNYVQGYFHSLQLPFGGMTAVIKSSVEPAGLTAAVRSQVAALDPTQPIYNVRTMEQIRDESVATEKLNLTLLILFASVALVLALVGIYGVMSYAVTQRTHEIGIRVALGARGVDVLRLVVGHGMLLAGVGVAVGLVMAYGLTRLMSALLFSVKPTDLPTFTAVTALLVVVALVACWIPARRAAKVDPMVALRCE
jgi:putative ABC transport system permease protein